MAVIKFKSGELSPGEQDVVNAGFARHTEDSGAPPFERTRLSWTASDDAGRLIGVLTSDLLWDWLYVDELWVDDTHRGSGLGVALMKQAEEHAASLNLTGVWLWTQSWQAEGFYKRLGYEEFARLPDFPKGHDRIGFRKLIAA